MSDMSQFSFQWDGLNQVPGLLVEIEREVRGLQPLLEPGAAAQASASIVASAMTEFSASMSAFIEQNASDLHGDVERFGQVIRNYSDADRSVVDSSEALCQRTNPVSSFQLRR